MLFKLFFGSLTHFLGKVAPSQDRTYFFPVSVFPFCFCSSAKGTSVFLFCSGLVVLKGNGRFIHSSNSVSVALTKATKRKLESRIKYSPTMAREREREEDWRKNERDIYRKSLVDDFDGHTNVHIKLIFRTYFASWHTVFRLFFCIFLFYIRLWLWSLFYAHLYTDTHAHITYAIALRLPSTKASRTKHKSTFFWFNCSILRPIWPSK